MFSLSNVLYSFRYLPHGTVGVFGFFLVDRHSDPCLKLPLQGSNIAEAYLDLSFILCVLFVVVHFAPRQSQPFQAELLFRCTDNVRGDRDMAEIESVCRSGNIGDEKIFHCHVHPLLGLTDCHIKTVVPVCQRESEVARPEVL